MVSNKKLTGKYQTKYCSRACYEIGRVKKGTRRQRLREWVLKESLTFQTPFTARGITEHLNKMPPHLKPHTRTEVTVMQVRVYLRCAHHLNRSYGMYTTKED